MQDAAELFPPSSSPPVHAASTMAAPSVKATPAARRRDFCVVRMRILLDPGCRRVFIDEEAQVKTWADIGPGVVVRGDRGEG
ncbi:hypothetical protein CTE05_19020 [Cellulomonas terrae]|uniref:Uncharacterized protein n=1 Tax=Cellulomonas terrae TaxID=311234 RepID=A0A511JKB8_9CELL|nr:hypothetical protein CTE05_19020 [Cellulomonas terrae]